MEEEKGGKRRIRVGADERSEEKSGADPVLRDLVVDLRRKILPETRHYLLLEWRQSVHHRLHPHRLLPHLLLLRLLVRVSVYLCLCLSDQFDMNDSTRLSTIEHPKPNGINENKQGKLLRCTLNYSFLHNAPQIFNFNKIHPEFKNQLQLMSNNLRM